MSRCFLLFTVVAFCFGCSRVELDVFGDIAGTVSDEITKEPLAGVKVSLTPDGTSQVTGTDGAFQFEKLDAQEYTLVFTKDDYVSQTQKVSVKAGKASNVQVALEPIVPVLKVSAEKLNFGYEVSSLALDIANSGKGSLKWKISENIEWLSCSPESGTTGNESSSVVVTVSRAEMERGSYNGMLVISSNGGSKEIPVSMSVENVNLNVTPSELNFGSLTNSQQLTLENTGLGTLEYTVKSSNEWLILNKEAGTVTKTDYVEAIVSREGLSAGQYNATITFSVAGGDVVVPVNMEIAVNEKPTVTAENASDITYNSAVLHGTMVSVGSDKVTGYGFCWSEEPVPTIEDTRSNHGDCTAPGVFESVANNLKSDTKYYFRAYAENSVGIVYSEKELSFITAGLPTLPIVVSGAVSEITSTTASAKGNIASLGNVSMVTAYGHVWSKTAGPTLQTGKYTNLGEATEAMAFTSEITGLDAHTIYYIRAYATNEKGTSYGEESVFTTAKTDVRLTTSEVTEIIHNAATCGGVIADDGGHEITECGVCWSTGQSPVIEDNHAAAAENTGDSFSCRITDLTKETQYYVRAYAKASDGNVFYGNEKQFTTTEEVSLPVLSGISVSNIQTASVTVIGRIESDGNSAITECGFCYSVSPDPTVETGYNVACDPSSAELGKNITGLEEGTVYHIKAYARNSMGIAYSDEMEFKTLAVTVPVLGAVSVNNVGRTTAYVSSSIIDEGNANVSECGFCWATNPFPTVYDNKVACDAGTSFKTKLTDLPILTTVYVRSYAVNSKGTGYSDDASFTTIDTDTDIWDGTSVATKFGGGMGTESDPIIINSADQLKLLAENVNNGTTYSGVYFRLDVNINLNNSLWTPIGTSENYPFKGSFNGNGHKISGINIKSDRSSQGLFGYISGGDYISDLYVSGHIKGIDEVGSICGTAYNYKTISNCHSDCEIQGQSKVGGLAGYIECDTDMTFTLVNSSNQGNVSGVKYTGGLIGYSRCNGYNSGRYANIIIVNNVNHGGVSSTNNAGGIAGFVYSVSGTYYGTSYTSISNCVNYSNVSAASNKGGIIGSASYRSDELAIENSYWLYDIVNNIGIETGFGNNIKTECVYFMRSSTSCLLQNGNDLNVMLNQWITDNMTNLSYRRWKYETIDGYACPVFEE